ncbi:MAG: RICIN domain-containing protein [Saccharofermentanales bacterium]
MYVDPTLTFAENTDINDAIIYSGSPSVAHGSNYYNYIGYYNTMYGVGRLLVKFPGMTGNGTYASLWDSQLLSVYYNAYTDGTNQSTTIRPYIYTGSAWTESTVTCNMVSWNGTVTLTDMPAVTVPNSAGNIAFDITAAAKAWKNETYSASSGLMLKNSNEYSSSYYKIFTSTEYGSYYGTHMPYTVVNYSVVTLPTYETQGIASGDIFKITNTYSGKSIDIEGGGTTDNTNAIQYSFSTSGFTRSSSNQWFEITYIGTGEYEIRPMHTTGKILSINSTSKNVIIETDCNYTRQRWYIVKSGDDYYIINKAYKTEFITVEGSYTSGDPVKSSTNSSGSKWKFVDLNIFHLNSRYDDSYFSAYPNAADNISRIDTYHDFAALAYDDFGITIKSDAYAQHISSLADECSRGLTTACNNDCGTNCFTDHHKNTLALSDEIFNGSRDENHIYVQWMEYNTNVLCSSNNATHTSTGALASVWNKRPVIGMYGRQNNNRDRIGKAVLIHEMAHSFGHRDVYDDDGHDQIFITGCAMEKYKVELWPYEPVKDFIEDVENGDVAFCEDCIDEMEPLIENRYFAGN